MRKYIAAFFVLGLIACQSWAQWTWGSAVAATGTQRSLAVRTISGTQYVCIAGGSTAKAAPTTFAVCTYDQYGNPSGFTSGTASNTIKSGVANVGVADVDICTTESGAAYAIIALRKYETSSSVEKLNFYTSTLSNIANSSATWSTPVEIAGTEVSQANLDNSTVRHRVDVECAFDESDQVVSYAVSWGMSEFSIDGDTSPCGHIPECENWGQYCYFKYGMFAVRSDDMGTFLVPNCDGYNEPCGGNPVGIYATYCDCGSERTSPVESQVSVVAGGGETYVAYDRVNPTYLVTYGIGFLTTDSTFAQYAGTTMLRTGTTPALQIANDAGKLYLAYASGNIKYAEASLSTGSWNTTDTVVYGSISACRTLIVDDSVSPPHMDIGANHGSNAPRVHTNRTSGMSWTSNVPNASSDNVIEIGLAKIGSDPYLFVLTNDGSVAKVRRGT